MGSLFRVGEETEEYLLNADTYWNWEDIMTRRNELTRDSRPVRQSAPTLTDVQQIAALRDKWLGCNESIR